MKTNGWYWDEESQRWTVNRGKFIVTVKLPKDHVPELGATLFGVQINETRAKLHDSLMAAFKRLQEEGNKPL
jgi:hypothetical protein